MNQQVDIYDLDRKRDMGTDNPENKQKFIKETKEIGTLTDFNRKLICP